MSLIKSDMQKRPPRGRRLAPADAGVAADSLDEVRLSVTEARAALGAAADRLALPRSPWSSEPFNILAVSGGAAGGAYGAGLLVGLTQAGCRPRFSIVTGVSTGALIAPFAFLGPEWDERLREAYTGGHAERLLSLRGLGSGAGLFRTDTLESLIYPFVDEKLLAAVAAEHVQGRRLLVATTDLDRQQTCIWDMGAIAARGDESAVTLFRDVLVASASLPGLFPPKLLPTSADGELYEEMHVDGGVSTPLFIMPEALMRWRTLGRRLRKGRIYVIVNTVLEPAPRTTPTNVASVVVRSFEAMLRFSYRQAVSTTATFCAGANLPLSVASIPPTPERGGMLNFTTRAMKELFDAAVETASTAREGVWSSVAEPQDPLADLLTWPGLQLGRRPPV